MRILCDIDGVIYDFMRAFLDCYMDAGGEVPADFVPRTYDSINILPDKAAIAEAWNHAGLFRNGDPLAGSIVALEEMNAAHDLTLATKIVRPWCRHVPSRMDWLRLYCPFLVDRQIMIAFDKSQIYGDVLIEDYPPNLSEWLAEWPTGLGVLINQPWNKSIDAGELGNCQRYGDLLSFVEEEL